MTALATDRLTLFKEMGLKAYPVEAAVKIYAGSLVMVNAAGYAAPAANTAGCHLVGLAVDTVDNLLGAAAALWVQVRYPVVALLAASSITQAMVGEAMYVVDDQTVDDAAGNVFAGVLLEYVSTTSGWVLIGPGVLPLDQVTASAAQLNKLAALSATGYPVIAEEVTFTQTSGAGTYTGTVALPAGARILDIGVDGQALWDGTSASLIVGDGADNDGFFVATDLVATDLLAGEINNLEHPGGKAGVYIAAEQRKLYQATSRNVIGVLTQVGTGTLGRTRMYVVYAVPTAVAATKA